MDPQMDLITFICSMAKKGFNIIKCKATSTLLELYDIKEGDGCKTKEVGNISYYRVLFDARYARMIYSLIKDINIYIPSKRIYLSDYILLKKIPDESIFRLIDYLSMDDMFGAYFSQQRAFKNTNNL